MNCFQTPSEGPDPWFAWYWSHSDGEGNVSYSFWVRDMDIRAWEKLHSLLKTFIEEERMTPRQREILVPLLQRMRQAGRIAPSMNEWNRIHNLCNQLRDFLDCEPSDKTAEQWIEIAETECGKEVQG